MSPTITFAGLAILLGALSGCSSTPTTTTSDAGAPSGLFKCGSGTLRTGT